MNGRCANRELSQRRGSNNQELQVCQFSLSQPKGSPQTVSQLCAQDSEKPAYLNNAAHDYPHAIEQNRGSVELDPNFAAAHLLLGEDYVQAGLRNEAVDELRKAADLSGDSPIYRAQVAVALAVAGRNREALRIAHELEAISRKRYVSPYGLAQIYAALNKKEDTFKWLQAAYDEHAVWMGYLAVDPIP